MNLNKLILAMIAISFFVFISENVIAGSGECTQSGYDYCYYSRYTYYSAEAFAKVYWKFIDGNGNTYKNGFPGGYAVKYLNVDVGYSGDYLYEMKNYASWDSLDDTCSEYGCAGNEASAGIKRIASAGQTYNTCLAYEAYDRNDNNGYWAWTTAGYGFLNNCGLSIKVVNCYANTDCSSNYYCDKLGTWNQWSCQLKDCELGQTRCSGMNYQICENYKWKDNGLTVGQCNVNCLQGQTKCDSTNYNTCSLSYTWSNLGPTINQCGVTCISGDKCDNGKYLTCESFKYKDNGYIVGKCGIECINESFCDGQLLSECMNYKLIDKGRTVGQCGVFCTLDSECDYKCSEGYCKSFMEYNKTMIFVISGAVFIIAVIFSLVILRRK